MVEKLRKWSLISKNVGRFFLIAFLIPSAAWSQEKYLFERMWPALQQPWYFDDPQGVTIDADDNVYIADSGNSRVQKFRLDGTFVTKWGTSGSKSGQFSRPGGICVDKDGCVYVCDTGNYRVQKFTSNGEFETMWGSRGSGDGQFGSPVGIAADDAGNIFVADSGNNRIQVFSNDGFFIDKWGTSGAGEGEFNYPEGLAIYSDGHVLVADSRNNRIQKFTPEGAFVCKWGAGSWPDDGSLSNPGSVAADQDGNVYVTDTFGISKFDGHGEFVSTWRGSDSGGESIGYPTGIAVDSSGDVYVAGSFNQAVWKFSSYGKTIAIWGSTGTGEGSFDSPSEIAGDSAGNVYVADSENNLVQKFGPYGGFIAEWTGTDFSDTFRSPDSIAVDADDNVYVLDDLFNTIVKVDSDGNLIWMRDYSEICEGSYMRGMAVDSQGNVYLPSYWGSMIEKLDADGQFVSRWGTSGDGEGEFWCLNGVAVDGDDNVYALDGHGIQKFTSDGEFLVKWESSDTGGPSFSSQSEGICVDSQGNIYVADSDNHRILKFSGEGKYIAQFGEFGSDPGQLKNPAGVWVGTNGKVYAADTVNNRVQVFSEEGSQDWQPVNAKAVIVAGGGPYAANNIWVATEMCANYAYRALLYQGYSKDSIYYLSGRTDLDLDGNGVLDDVDADATNANLRNAILEWATDADELFIYMIDHGGKEVFRTSATELLQASQLDSWLDTLQETMPGKVALLYDACRSGSFLPCLTPPAGKERMVATSASADQEALFCSQGTLSFSFMFWARFFNGDSFYTSFVQASNGIGLTWDQTPLIDSNGNGVGNEKADRETASALRIGNQTATAGDIPVIGEVSPKRTLDEGSSCLIYAADVIDADGISRVWAVVTPPDHSSGSLDEPVTDLPIVDLKAVGNNRYEVDYDGFAVPGTYKVAVFAMDGNAVASLPVSTSVTVAGEGPSAETDRLYFPHVASGGDWETEICVINNNDEGAIEGSFTPYDDTGTAVSTPISATLAPHARRQIVVGDEFEEASAIAYIVFEADGPGAVGYVKFYTEGRYRVAIPAVSEVNEGDIFVSHIASDATWATGIGLLNTESTPKDIEIEFDNGESKSLRLEAREHRSFTIRSLFGNQARPDIASAVVKNASGVVGLEIFGSVQGAGKNLLSGILLKDDTATEMYYTHVASDAEWFTGIVAYNPSSSDCFLTVVPYSQDGESLTPKAVKVEGGKKYVGTARALGFPDGSAWFRIVATSPITGFELFTCSDGNRLAGYTGVGIERSSGVLPKIESDGWTSIALVNVEDIATALELTAYDDDGNATATEVIQMDPHEKVMGAPRDLFSQDIGAATYIRFSSDTRMTGLQLNNSSDNMMLDALPGMSQ